MRKLLLSLVVVLFSFYAMAQQTQVIPLSAGENQMELKSVTPDYFNAEITLKELSLENKSTSDGDFSILEVEGLTKPANVGQANLPVASNLIEVPYGAEIQINILGYDEEVINLDDYGINRIEPTQPSYSKSTPDEEQYFVIDNDYYNTDVYETTDLVKAEIHGVMRGVQIGRIEVRPYHYNPVENTVIVYNNLEYEVNFVGADLALTEEMKSKYYTPEFEGSFNVLFNYQAPAAKDAFVDYAAPVKYVIVANRAFESTLEPFVNWKTKQGYNVIEAYTDDIGSSNTEIQSYLEDLYNAGTALDPAPLYVLIIGDHSGTYSIPAFATQLTGAYGGHVTDLFFACYDGGSDYLPDLYYGRISANSTTELQNALDKILPYEQYTIPDGSFLNRCMLIAGVDSYGHSPTHGDGTLYYGINEYFNTGNGYDNVYGYYYSLSSGPEYYMSSNSGSASGDIISKIQGGIGFANYTAHCSHDGWADPEVNRSDISSFNNVDEYPFMIGNCCLSFEFNQSDAFGEMVIYAENEGAIGYIGNSNSSYWDEDVYWGIGVTSLSITEANADNHAYSNTGLGAYDGIWHMNGEDFSDWYYTGRQIAHKGNLAVEASSSSIKQYYWEIYHLVGDPSLAPYNTKPEALTLTYTNPMVGDASLTVTTEAYTYVALSKDNVLLDAQWSGSGTSVTLTPPSSFTGDTYCVVGTKQDRAPYINESVVPTAANPPVAEFSGTPTTIIEGESVTFTDESQYASTWDWDFGDGQTSNEQNPVHTYTNQGTYTVSLTVTNPLPGTDTETKNAYITVNENTNPPTADFEADQTTINVGGTVNFTDLSINNPTSWDWVFEGGTPATSSDQNPSIVYSTPGTYDVTLVATNSHGPDDEIKSGYITVVAPDVIMSDGTTTACAGTFKDSGGDGDYSNSENLTHTFYPATPGAFVQLTFTSLDVEPDGSDCFDYITIYNGENTSAAQIGQYCGTDHTVIGTNGVVTSTDVTGALTVVFESDTYVVQGGWEADISCYEPTSPPVADFTANITTVNVGGSVDFTDYSTNGPTSWAWSFDGAETATSEDQNPTGIVYNTIGTYDVELTATNSFGSDTETKVAYINVVLDYCDAAATDEDEYISNVTFNTINNDSGWDGYGDYLDQSTTVTKGSSYSIEVTDAISYSQDEALVWIDYNIDGDFEDSGEFVYEGAALGGTSTHNPYTWTGTIDIPTTATVGTTRMRVRLNYNTSFSGSTPNSTSCGDGTYGDVEDYTIVIEEGAAIPVADFSAEETIGCETLTVNFTDLSTGVPDTWSWDFGDGSSTSSDTNPTHTYTTPGTYTVELTVSNSMGTDVAIYTDLITVDAMPTVDDPADVTACDTYTLPALSNGDYYLSSGGISPVSVGYNVTATTTIYVWDVNGTCEAENSFLVTINETPVVDAPADVTECGSYILPALTNGDYYQDAGGVNPLSVGYEVTSDMTIYVYEETGTTPNCFDQNSFTVTILNAPIIDEPADVSACETYTLPTLSNGAYFLSSNGVNPVSAGYEITGTTTVYVWATNGTCDSEHSFTVTIDDMPLVDAPADVEACGEYILPALTNGAYYTNSGGVGSISVGTPITSDQTIYVYNSNGSCEAENSFSVTILDAPVIDEPADVSACETYTLPTLSNGAYFLSPNGVNPVSPGYEITGTTTVYVWATNGICDSEHSFTVTIYDMPLVDAPADVEACGEYILPALTNGAYYTNSGGVGSISVGTPITSDQTIYVYNSNGSCEAENSFAVTIFDTFTANAVATDESAEGANDGSVTVTMTGGTTPFSGTWNPSGTTNTTGSSMTLSDLTGGYYSVIVEDSNGCTASAGATVNTLGLEPIADFEANVTEGCETLTVNFTDLSTNSPTVYVWNFGDGSATSSDVNPTHIYDSPGVYTVTLFVENDEGDDNISKIDLIHVYQNPTVTVDVTPASGETVSDGSAFADITGGTPDYSITWSDDQEGLNAIGLLPGNYSVVVEDVNGCFATAAFVVDWVNIVGKEDFVYNIYPNPVDETLFISFDNKVCERIEIYDMLGQIVNSIKPNNDNTSVDVSNIISGVYFIRIVFDDKEYTHKLIVK